MSTDMQCSTLVCMLCSILRLEEPMDGDHRQPEDEITHDLDDPEDVIHPPCPFCCDCYAPCERKYDKTRLPDDGLV